MGVDFSKKDFHFDVSMAKLLFMLEQACMVYLLLRRFYKQKPQNTWRQASHRD
jgi:hypothetical protein